MLSRQKADWARSTYEKRRKDLRKIAKVYCQTVLEDYRVRQKLERKYPGRIMDLIYEDFIQAPHEKLHQVYNFLHLKVGDDFLGRFEVKTGGNRSAIISSKWKTRLKAADVTVIQGECEEFSLETGLTWDLW